MTITPDTKDWTWVLGAACPECGYDARTVPATDVASRIRATVPLWLDVLDAQDAAVRLALMLDEDDPLFANWDQDVTALEERYDLQDPVVVAEELEQAADAIAAAFDVVGDRWDRAGRRSDGSAFTVDTFARYYLHDIEHHTWDVTGRAAGSWL